MSRFLDRLELIKEGAPARLGFGVPRAEKSPGMALVALVSGDHAKGMDAVASLKPDAALVAGANGATELGDLAKSLANDLPWGARVSSLGEEESKALQEAGCDILAFSLEGTSVAAVASSDEVARILCLDADIDIEELRTLDLLPIDILLLSIKTPSNPWTLEDLASIARVGRRVDKYVLVELSQQPSAKELEALRDAGVSGLVLDIGKVSSETLSGLKAALLDMPRPTFGKKDRAMAIIPSSSFPSASNPEPEQEDDDDDDE